MLRQTLSRRRLLQGAGAALAAPLFATPLRAQAPAPSAITPALIEAARKEGKVSFYTATELQIAEKFCRAYETK
jgi:iron(III) transport system substrate-binding protein